MALFVALLRGINVGGSGVLSMRELSDLCSGLGFESVRTHIQSGNVIFHSRLSETSIQSRLENALTARLNKKIDVMVRTPEELRLIVSNNPFTGKEGSKVAVAFLGAPPPEDLQERVDAPGGEQIHLGRRELYIHFPNGMGRSKLKLPLNGTATTVRNINTVTRLLAMTEP